MSEHFKSLTFKSLVEAIDEKWGHTYIDVEYEEETADEKSIEEILKEIEKMEKK